MPTLIFPGSTSYDGSVNSSYPNGDKPESILVASARFAGAALDDGWSSAGDTYLSYLEGSILAEYPDTSPAGTASPLIVPTGAVILGENEVFFEFDAYKTAGGGSKFLKVHGQEQGSGTNYANCTFNMTYGSGNIDTIIFGDGSGVANDASAIINLATGTANGRNSGIASVSCPNGIWSWPDTDWHNFKLHVKFNTGTTALNEVNDGEFHMYVDDVPYVIATGLFNRHYSNLPIEYCEFLSLTQNTSAFDLGMRNINVSLNGWMP